MAKATRTQEIATAVRRGNNMATAGFYSNVDPGISVRAPMDRRTYEYFREEERIPKGLNQEECRHIMAMCKAAYERVGVIRSVVDMMSEFGAEGVEILHPDEGPNAFYKAWQEKVQLPDRSERFLSWYYKAGNTVVRRKFGKIATKDLKKLKNYDQTLDNSGTGRIPIEYVFYDPATIELVGGSIGALSSNKMYALRIPFTFFDGFRTPRNELEKKVYDALPQEIKDALVGKTNNSGLYLLPIEGNKLHVAYYKKDDSDLWGKSFIYSILDDIIYNDKLKLAKTSALDSWYNVIRIWKLGDHKEKLAPSPDAGAKLASLLEANTGGGGADIIWSSDIVLDEHYPPVEKLVNFEENTHNILMGLGVPEGLVGGKATGSAGMTQNYLGLKNLIKRLEAGRRALRMWLNEEIDIIQKEMGFKKRPIIRFAHTDLHDEQTYFNLLMQLLDRNVISDTTVLERVNEIPEIERARIDAEEAARKDNLIPEKASPFHKPDLELQQKHELKKITHQAKTQQDFPPPPSKGPDNSTNVQKRTNKTKMTRGRPTGSKDKVTRKRGATKVKASMAQLLVEANKIYDYVDTVIKNHALKVYNISNARQLSSAQEQDLDKIRLCTFAHIAPFTELSEESVLQAMRDQEGPIEEFLEEYNLVLSDLGSESINQEQKKILRTSVYADIWCDGEDNDDSL